MKIYSKYLLQFFIYIYLPLTSNKMTPLKMFHCNRLHPCVIKWKLHKAEKPENVLKNTNAKGSVTVTNLPSRKKRLTPLSHNFLCFKHNAKIKVSWWNHFFKVFADSNFSFFICYLTIPRLTLGCCWGDGLIHKVTRSLLMRLSP